MCDNNNNNDSNTINKRNHHKLINVRVLSLQLSIPRALDHSRSQNMHNANPRSQNRFPQDDGNTSGTGNSGIGDHARQGSSSWEHCPSFPQGVVDRALGTGQKEAVGRRRHAGEASSAGGGHSSGDPFINAGAGGLDDLDFSQSLYSPLTPEPSMPVLSPASSLTNVVQQYPFVSGGVLTGSGSGSVYASTDEGGEHSHAGVTTTSTPTTTTAAMTMTTGWNPWSSEFGKSPLATSVREAAATLATVPPPNVPPPPVSYLLC